MHHKSSQRMARNRFARFTKPFRGTRETVLKQDGITAAANNGGKHAEEDAPEAQMNHSFHSADRTTHLKIVVVALVAGIAVAGLGISARTNTDYAQATHVTKAGKPTMVTNSDATMIR
jgi:hypothetical protein